MNQRANGAARPLPRATRACIGRLLSMALLVPSMAWAAPDASTQLDRHVDSGDPKVPVARTQAHASHRDDATASLVSEENARRLDADPHHAAAEAYTSLGDLRRANGELQQWVQSERDSARADDDARLRQLKVRFDLDLKNRDNALFTARAAEADSRRLTLVLALVLSVLVLGGGALLLVVRLLAQRASSDILARLARNGREMTIDLDRPTVIATLHRQLGALTPASPTTVWLRGSSGFERAGESVRRAGGGHAAIGSGERDDASPAPPDVERLVVRCAELGTEMMETLPAPANAAVRALQVFEPLLDGEQVIGVVRLEFADARRYSNRVRQTVRTTCLYAAVALANIRTAELLGEAQVELEQERTRDMLVHTARLVTVGSMASGIVHEMSHPVGAMMLQSSNAQASLEIGESVEANEALTGIHREARRLQNLITRLRNLCRADPPRIEDIDLLAVLEDARVLFQPQLQMARVEFVQDAASLVVAVDAERVVLAIANIVFNAIDAMEGRPVKRVEITASARDGFACVDIRDTGPGLTPAQLARLFEPFYTTKPPGKGLGLGLALSVKSVASMDGRIEATNHPDGGALFSVCLPLASESRRLSPTESATAGRGSRSGDQGPGS